MLPSVLEFALSNVITKYQDNVLNTISANYGTDQKILFVLYLKVASQLRPQNFLLDS